MLILPILIRLYTSVIVLDPEIWTDKESWPTDLSPTTIFLRRTGPAEQLTVRAWGGRGVPGVWDRVGGSGGYTGTHPDPLTDPYSVIF